MTKWEYTTKRVHILALQDTLREYGKWGWELVHVIEMYQEPVLVFKRPEERDYNVTVLAKDPSPTLSVGAAKAQLGLDDVASLEDQEGTGSEASARSHHPSASFDGVPSTPRIQPV